MHVAAGAARQAVIPILSNRCRHPLSPRNLRSLRHLQNLRLCSLYPRQPWIGPRDILQTDLAINIATRSATAVVELAGSTSEAASFETGDLAINAVTAEVAGEPRALNYMAGADSLHVGVPASTEPASITIEYGYNLQHQFEGALATGLTFTWPYYCGNLFPCRSNPDDGLQFKLAIEGVPPEQQAIFATDIAMNAPSYMLAWAVGDYSYVDLGATAAGTRVGVWHLPGGAEEAIAGTVSLREVFSWLESSYGPYLYGSQVASVAADWGSDGFGGMEHHPFWHVASGSMEDASAHAHEAAHGWFGNGVRIACWEDFVLSEGLATYLAARGIEQVAGESEGNLVWERYQSRLDRLQSSGLNKIAWPAGCADIDILADGLFGDAPYVKGAFFMRALEQRIGRAELDAILRLFYTRNAGHAARMRDLLDLVASQSGYDPGNCARAWLQSSAVPDFEICQ